MTLLPYITNPKDAINQSKSHEEELRIVVENFDGRCTDESTKFDFSVDYDAYKDAREKSIAMFIPLLIIVPIYFF